MSFAGNRLYFANADPGWNTPTNYQEPFYYS